MLLELFWTLVFVVLAAGTIGSVVDPSDSFPSGDPTQTLFSLVSAFLFVGLSLVASWEFLAAPVCDWLDRVVPQRGAVIHDWTVFVLCLVALVAYASVIAVAGYVLVNKVSPRRWLIKRRAARRTT